MEANDWNDAERRVERAQELFEQHKWLEALDELRAATSINPYNSAWHFNIGLTLDELGRLDEAIDAYERSLEIEPNDVPAMHRMGMDLHHVGRFDEALRTFERIGSIDATYEPAYCSRILTYCELGEHDRAEEMFYLARLYKEHCPNCYYNIGCSLQARGMFDKAIFCWNKTLDLDISHPQVHLRIAEALWSKGELEQARQHYLSGLRQDPGCTATLLDLSDLLMEVKRWDEAGEKINRAIEMSPDDPAGHYCYGRWLARRERYDEGAEALRKSLSLDPTYPGSHLELARIEHQRNNLDETRQHLRAEILLRPEDPQTLMDLSNLLIDVAEPRAAAACLKRLVQIDANAAGAWQNLAVAQFMRRRWDEGVAASQESLRIDPHNIPARHNLAMALGQMGKFDDALREASGALRLNRKDRALQSLELRLRILHARARLATFVRGLFGSR
jgi:tetratricopeptide (TPR) repeat protein